MSRDFVYNIMFVEYPDVITITDLAEMLGIGKKKAYALVRSEEIPKIPCSQASIRIAKYDVIRFVIEKNTQQKCEYNLQNLA